MHRPHRRNHLLRQKRIAPQEHKHEKQCREIGNIRKYLHCMALNLKICK